MVILPAQIDEALGILCFLHRPNKKKLHVYKCAQPTARGGMFYGPGPYDAQVNFQVDRSPQIMVNRRALATQL